MKEIVKNQFNIHLLVEMVLRVDEFFIMYYNAKYFLQN